MRVTVFGASGKTGRQVVAVALERGHEVVAFVHSHNPFEVHRNLKVVKGDIRDRTAVAAAITESKAVISALGSWGTKEKNIVSTGMQAIIPAMEQMKVKRLVTLTGGGARWSEDQPGFVDRVSHSLMGVAAGKILRDSEEHLRLLDASKLEWTTVRSPVMKARGAPTYYLDFQAPSVVATIPRPAVAQALVDQLESFDVLRKAPYIHAA